MIWQRKVVIKGWKKMIIAKGKSQEQKKVRETNSQLEKHCMWGYESLYLHLNIWFLFHH